MEQNKILVTNIQRMSFHDGPGIRTTFFLKGCPLKCPWCANPENISYCQEEYIYEQQKKVYGEYYSLDQLFEIALKDYDFYDKDGGVTFSGGEPLTHFEKLEPLLSNLKQEKVHMCVETSLYCNLDQLKIAMKYIDLFFVDIKILETERSLNIQGGSVSSYMRNIEILRNNKCNIIFRIPIINEYTNTEKNLALILNFLKEFSDYPVELLKQHNLGKTKYETLNRKFLKLKPINNKYLYNLKKEIENIGIKEVSILEI